MCCSSRTVFIVDLSTTHLCPTLTYHSFTLSRAFMTGFIIGVETNARGVLMVHVLDLE